MSFRQLMTREASQKAFSNLLIATTVTVAVCSHSASGIGPAGPGFIAAATTGQVRSLTDRRTADALLKRSRQAVADGNVELAEWYLTRAEALNVKYDSVFQRFVDTPAKVREAIAALKKNPGAARTTVKQTPPAKTDIPASQLINQIAKGQTPSMPASGATASQLKQQASSYLQNGRLALAEGDVNKALDWYKSALATGATFGPDEYSPAALASALKSYEALPAELPKITQPNIKPATSPAEPAKLMDPAIIRRSKSVAVAQADPKLDSISLLKRGTKMHSTGTAVQTSHNEPVSQPKPNTGAVNIPQTKAQRDRIEAMRLLSKAKVAADQGELQLAEKLALQAQNLRVPDSAYQRGDTRPWMVLMDIGRRQDRVSAYRNSEKVAHGIKSPPLPTSTNYTDRSRNVLATAEVPVTDAATNAARNLAGQTAQAARNTATNAAQRVANGVSQVANRASQRVAQAINAVPDAPNLAIPTPAVPTPATRTPVQTTVSTPTPSDLMIPDVTTIGPPPTPPTLVVPNTNATDIANIPSFNPVVTTPSTGTPSNTAGTVPPVAAPPTQSVSQNVKTDASVTTLPGVPQPTMPAVTLPQVSPPRITTTPEVYSPVVDNPKPTRQPAAAKSQLAEDLLGPSNLDRHYPKTDSVTDGISQYTNSLLDDLAGESNTLANEFRVNVPQFDVPSVRTPQIETTSQLETAPSLPNVAPVATTTPTPQSTIPTAPQLVIEAPEADLQPIPEPQLPPVVTAPQNTPVLTQDAPPLSIAPESMSPITSPTATPGLGSGETLFRRGLKALSNSSIAEARSLFLEAWKYEAELAPDVRQQLQDQLQASRAKPDAPEEPAPLRNRDDEKVRRLIGEMSRQQAAINAVRESDPMKAWEMIKQLRLTVAESEVPDATRRRLLDRVNRAARDMETYISTNRGRIENDERNKKILAEVDRMREQRLRNQQELAELVDQFEELIDQQRFPEAKVIAKRASEIDPQNEVVVNMLWKSQVANQVMRKISREQKLSQNVATVLQDIDDSAVPIEGDLEFPDARYWKQLSESRREALARNRRKYTETEQEIYQALKNQVDVQFESQPLEDVLEKLSQISGINVFVDPEGLTAEGVTSNTLVSLSLRKPVSLKSALNLILQPLHLSYVVQDEVLRVTSEQVRDGDVETEVYHVADLVIPIPNFAPGTERGLPSALREGYNMINSVGYQGGYRTMPLTVDNQQGAGGNSSVLAQMGISPSMGSGGVRTGMPMQPAFGPQNAGGAAQADFSTLMELITTTVAPETWEEVGGTGSIAPFPTNLSLVVAQTQEVHEKIVDLLAQLRRLQDLQVTIEVRFITLNDDFFERIGVDFNFDIDDNSGLTTADITNLDDDGPSVTVGLDPTGVPRVDLDVGFTQGSFASAVPAFGGFDAGGAANLGFAILSDIEAFFVIEAAQGDTRTNVLQAPKVTLFNGQNATVSDQSQQPFVTSIIPVVGDFAAAHQPVITVLTEGTSLSVQAVVSQDRRFVRLTLVPFFSQIRDVDTFTFDGTTNSDTGTNVVDPTDDTNTVIDNARDTTTGTTVQLPTFAFTSVSTTVSVPDGGTILLGGIKRLQEGRIERGVPMLSKLPYINRLFKNVGIGRETQSLMMMVTPRIIIQEEEEEKLGLNLP